MLKFIFLILLSLNSFSEANFTRHSLGFGIGQTLLFNDFAELGEDKIGYDLYYSYRASYTFSFLLNAHTDEFKTPTSSVKTLSFNAGIKAKMFDFDSFSPFWSAGLGFYWPKVNYTENGKKESPSSKAVFGLNASLGIDLKLNKRFSIGFLSHYHHPFKTDFENGLKFSGSYLKLLIQPSITF